MVPEHDWEEKKKEGSEICSEYVGLRRNGMRREIEREIGEGGGSGKTLLSSEIENRRGFILLSVESGAETNRR